MRLFLVGWPAGNDDIEPAYDITQPVSMDEMFGGGADLALFFLIDGKCGPFRIGAGGGADFNKNDLAAVEGHEVEFSAWAGVIAEQNAIAKPLQEPFGGTFGARSEPAPKPRPAAQRNSHDQVAAVSPAFVPAGAPFGLTSLFFTSRSRRRVDLPTRLRR